MDENLENGIQLFDSLIYILGDKNAPTFENADLEVEHAYRCLSNEVFELIIHPKELKESPGEMMADLLRMRTNAIVLVQQIRQRIASEQEGDMASDNYDRYGIALLILNKLDDLVQLLYDSRKQSKDLGI
ncbi:hypothetical protein [Pedobacter nutrimenti]|jgi:hypothetical protein|uniref:Uncharacterized protein n=1 Tax=Pedobacter nutrimenti TaxID=1241337 RepID=A0A318UNR6_9SPHI|nr:hypothetical protein [Pedobacter nutrimenti]PYF77180.1 hypothetical protein B0O44_101660 [Pedobacter nutrimenti]